MHKKDERRRILRLENEEIFLQTLSLVAEIIKPIELTDISIERCLPNPTKGFTCKGAIIYAHRTYAISTDPSKETALRFSEFSKALSPIGIFTMWGYWKPFYNIVHIDQNQIDDLMLTECSDSYYESKKYFPSGSQFPYPDSRYKIDYQKMQDIFMVMYKRFKNGYIKMKK